MNRRNEHSKYIRAKNRVERLKRFYTHLLIYLIINSGITTAKVWNNIGNGETLNEALFDFSTLFSWIVWGIVLVIHAFSVFGLPFILGYDWEARKIQQYLDKEQSENNL